MDFPSSSQIVGVVSEQPSTSNDPSHRPPGWFQAIFEQDFGYVWNALGRLGVADADREDIAQEVFMKVYERWASYDQTRPLRPWLFVFAYRAASDYRRLARHRHEVFGEMHAISDHASTVDAVDHDNQRLVRAALEKLGPNEQVVVIMHDIEEHSIREISEALGVPEGTLYSRLRVARERFTSAVRQLRARKAVG